MESPINIGVVGSRSFANYEFLKEILDEHFFLPIGDVLVKIISGGARGADALARQYSEERDLELIEFLPEWDKYSGKSAAIVRNQKIVDHSDIIVAFWDGESRGTRHTLRLAKKAGVSTRVYWKD